MLLGNGIQVRRGQGPQISVNYLATELLRAAGLDGGNYFNYLSALKNELPVITSRFMKEKDRFTDKPSQKTKDLLETYGMIEYYMLMDKEAAQ